jgi:DNA-binding beta-propeller fold protein YncE
MHGIAVFVRLLLMAAIGVLDQPFGLLVGPDGWLYVCEVGRNRVVKMPVGGGAVTVVAGTGVAGYSGDGGAAVKAELREPYELAFDPAGNLYFVERLNHVVRRVDGKTGVISTVAGTGVEGFSGDGGPGREAQFRQPHSLVFGPDGRLLICDILNGRIRALDLATGVVTTWAKDLKGPRALAVDGAGQMYLALREGNAVYKVDAKTRALTPFAGTGVKGYSGDGGAALAATLSGPKGVACGKDGRVYIADTENQAIRVVGRDGVITTLAGSLARPHGVAVGPDGTVYIGDSENNRVIRLP